MPASETTSAGTPAGSALARQKVLQAAGYKVALVTQVGGGRKGLLVHGAACTTAQLTCSDCAGLVGPRAGTHSCFQHYVRTWW